jgi:hypothetical protein
MASTYSDLKIELIGTGEQVGTWGATTNTNLGTALEEAIVGSADVVFSGSDVTLTLTNSNATQAARHLRLNLTGTSGGARNLILGSGCQIDKPYIINNGLADTVTVKNTTGTGIAVPAGKSTWVYNNGTDVVDAVTHLSSLTLGSALSAASGGTGRTTLTANNVILGNGTSAVGFVAPGSSGNILVSNGTTWTSTPNTFGDVVGPASATDNAIARFDSTTGKLIQNSSGATLTDTWNLGLGIAPTSKIHIYEASTAPSIQLENGSTNLSAGNDLGTINFISNDSSSSANGARVSLVGEVTNTTGNGRFAVIVKPSSSLFNFTALQVSSTAIIYPSGNLVGDFQTYEIFGSLTMSSSDTTMDVDISQYFSAASNGFSYMDVVVVGLYDNTPTSTARLWKAWQQGVWYDGTNFTLPGAALIGAAYTSDATNFPAGAINAVKVQTIVSGATVSLRFTNRTSPAAGSLTYYSYRTHIRNTF